MDLHRDLVLAAFLEGALQHDGVAGKNEILDLGAESVEQVGRGDGTESLAGLPCLQLQVQAEFVDLGGEGLGLVEFTGLTLGALGFEMVDLAEGGGSDLEGLAAGDQEIAGVAGADLDDVGFGSQGGNGFGEDDFGSGHKKNPGWFCW